MDINKVLSRQLNHSKLSENSLPTDLEEWQDFLKRVNNMYNEADEERYLLERSMDMSSREIIELNDKLENAQQIAGLGYWNLDMTSGKMSWSKELRKLVGLAPSDPVPEYYKFLLSVHPEYRTKIDTAIKHTLETGERYVLELPIRVINGTYRWHYFVGAPLHGSKPPYKHLEGIAMDITERKETEEKLRELNAQIISSAREVGMADVSVSILHNVGNVLNSVNVSSNLLVENLQKSHFKRFFDVCELIRKNQDKLVYYLFEDEKGKLIPQYLIDLADTMREDYAVSCSEVSNINEKIQNIRDIVMAQQSLSRVNAIHEKIRLTDIVKTTLMMVGTQLAEKNVKVVEDYHDVPEIYIDRSRLMQIIVNLLQNAKDALLEDSSGKAEKQIIITTKISEDDSSKILLVVEDNGVGISQENIAKIFGYGLKKKKHGHGIGLHSSAISASELGGKLRMESDGVGKGARFILELPLTEELLTGVKNVTIK